MSQDQQIQQMLGTLYAAPVQPELWNAFLQDLCSVGAVSKAALLAHDFSGNDHRILASSGDSVKEAAPLYEDHYCHFDEWTLRFPKQRLCGRVIQGEEIWPKPSLRRSMYYNEFLRPFDVCEMACLAFVGSPDLFEALSIFRGPRESAFGPEQLEVLEIVAPHLKTALFTRRKLLSLEFRVADLEDALDRLPSGLVLLDRKGRCILVNKAAKAILDRQNGLVLERYGSAGTELCARSARANTRLREIVSNCIAISEGKSRSGQRAMLISRLGRRPLQIVVAPFRQETFAISGTAAAIVFISDPEQEPAIPADVLRMLFGLTAAESRLALTLVEGKSLMEAAEVHCVSLETVRSQIKSVFHKTDTHRQSELMLLLGRVFGQVR